MLSKAEQTELSVIEIEGHVYLGLIEEDMDSGVVKVTEAIEGSPGKSGFKKYLTQKNLGKLISREFHGSAVSYQVRPLDKDELKELGVIVDFFNEIEELAPKMLVNSYFEQC